MRFFVLSCSQNKTGTTAKAENLYCSPNFVNSQLVARTYGDMYAIVSAKHGLLVPSSIVEPYDLALETLGAEELEKWSISIWCQLLKMASPDDEYVFLTNAFYSKVLRAAIPSGKLKVFFPFEAKSDKYRQRWLEQIMPSSSRLKHLSTFYEIQSLLTGGGCGDMPFRSFSPSKDFPKLGIYFFFESDQYRLFEFSKRVVRVGTHAVSLGSKSSLWTRLRTHRGTESGVGNHRGSIFRLHVGSAIINKTKIECSTWGKGQSAPKEVREEEEYLERKVSKFIGDMSFSWINVPGGSSADNDRAYIEKNSIALLSGTIGPVDVGSVGWLGYFAKHPAISESSLWNVNYVSDEYDENFLDVFCAYAEHTIGKKPAPSKQLAPNNWKQSRLILQQKLF